MNAPRLFPKIRYTCQKARNGEAAPKNPPFTRYEIALIQKCLVTCLRTASCPRCGQVFSMVRRARYGHLDRESWLVDCASCQRRAVIPVHRDPEPHAPRFVELPLSAPRRRSSVGALAARIGGAFGFSAVMFAGLPAAHGVEEAGAVSRLDTMLVVFSGPLEPRLPEVAQVALVAPALGPMIIPEVAPVSIPPIDLQLGSPAPMVPVRHHALGRSRFAGLVTESPAEKVRALHELDGLPDLVVAGPLRYPHDLRIWGIEGQVQVEFVLDERGRVEAQSIVIVSSTHEAFNAPARDAVLRSVYRPGTMDGQPVRVAVSLTLQFQLSGEVKP